MARRWQLAFLLVLPGPALAQDDPPLFADRPDFTESAAIIGRGRIQFEGGWTAQGDDRVGAHVFGTVLRTGISERWEVWIEGTWIAMDDARGDEVTGRGDADVGVKRVLRRAAPTRALDAALLVSSSVPVGEDGIGERGRQPEARFLLGWEATPRLALGVNAGVGLPLVGGERFAQALGSASLGVPLGPGLGAFAEVYGVSPADPGGGDAAYATGGLSVALAGGAALDVRVGAGLTEASSDWLFGLELMQGWRRP